MRVIKCSMQLHTVQCACAFFVPCAASPVQLFAALNYHPQGPWQGAGWQEARLETDVSSACRFAAGVWSYIRDGARRQLVHMPSSSCAIIFPSPGMPGLDLRVFHACALDGTSDSIIARRHRSAGGLAVPQIRSTATPLASHHSTSEDRRAPSGCSSTAAARARVLTVLWRTSPAGTVFLPCVFASLQHEVSSI